MRLLTASPGVSYARVGAGRPRPVRVGAVQHRWPPDPDEHRAALAEGVRMAAGEGARLVCLQELTLSPYFAVTPDGPRPGVEPEQLEGGPTTAFAAALAVETGAYVHASLWEARPGRTLGYNTAVVMAPDGTLASRTRKLHLPITAGYYEDRYFEPGPAEEAARPLPIGDARFGFPTCWDQWFPELARAYALAGTDVLVYPTAIGSEPDHPGFDTEPLWETVILGNGIANGTFMVAVNRIGTEDPLTFYGSSFISDPYGRKLVQAPRDEPAVLVATLIIWIRDLSQLCLPALTQEVERRCPIGLARPGGEGCLLGRRSRGDAPFVHGRLDVGPALGERPQDVLRDVGELAETVAPHLPAKAEGGPLGPERGLVEGAGGLLPGVEMAAVRGRPPTVCALDQVGHDDVGVELGIPSPAGPVAEGSTDEAIGFQQLLSPGTSLDEASLRRQVVEHGADGPVVGVRDPFPGVIRSKRPQE